MTKKILFITATRIGDAILSNGILDHLLRQYPDSKVTIVCGPLVASLYEGVPNLDRIIVLKKQKWKKHWVGLWRDVSKFRWDIVVDLRNSAVSRLIRAGARHIFGSHIDPSLHKAIQNAMVIGLHQPPPTRVWLTAAMERKAREIIPDGAPVLGIGPTANWIGKTWPVENFIDLVKILRDDAAPFKGWRVAVFSAPGEEPDALKLLQSLPEEAAIDVIAKGTPGEAVACLARCSFYIGNDSGLMHAAAAAGVPTLGLFGPTYPDIYGPYGMKADYITTPETQEELTGFDGFDPKTLGRSLMGGLAVDTVAEAAVKLKFETDS